MAHRKINTQFALGMTLLGCLLPTLAQAQETRVDSAAEGLTAHGHAEIKAKPDIAMATLSVTTQSKDQSQAISINATRTTSLLAALKKAGIAAKDIQTQSYTVQPQLDYSVSPAVQIGYQVVNSVQITIRDLTKVGSILDKASHAGATGTDGVNFDLADRHQTEGEALVAAVADARGKADLIAGAAGVSLGRLKSILEDGLPSFQAPPPRPFFAKAASAEAPSTPISPQQIVITADVTIVYTISPAR